MFFFGREQHFIIAVIAIAGQMSDICYIHDMLNLIAGGF